MSLEVYIQKAWENFSLDLSFSKETGPLGILGPSGSGKSMTLKAIAGIEKPDKGRIVLNGRTLFDGEKHVFVKPQKRRVGYLFQDYALFPNMTVEQNIACGILLPKAEKAERTQEMIRRFRLGGQEKKYPHELSGGQKQRVALGRILAYEPEALLLDEPFSALDAYLREELLLELSEILKEYQGDVVLVSHNRDEVYQLCPHLLVMDQGKSMEQGETKRLFQEPETFVTARMTGCKNFSRARKKGAYFVEALDWNLSFTTKRLVPDDIRYVGIRAYSFFVPEKEEEKNCLYPQNFQITEEPFESNLLFETEGGKKGIWWKVPKERWLSDYKAQLPRSLAVRPEDVMLLL